MDDLLEGAVLYPEVDEAALFREREKRRDRFICRYVQKLRQRGDVAKADEVHSSSGPHDCVPPEEM